MALRPMGDMRAQRGDLFLIFAGGRKPCGFLRPPAKINFAEEGAEAWLFCYLCGRRNPAGFFAHPRKDFHRGRRREGCILLPFLPTVLSSFYLWKTCLSKKSYAPYPIARRVIALPVTRGSLKARQCA